MKRAHLKYLVCPKCKTSLELKTTDESPEIKQGLLCCNSCGSSYQVHESIPRFVASENYATSFGLEWKRHSKSQYDSYTGISVSAERFFNETKWPNRLPGESILEVGCGSGRFTEQAASTGAMVIAFDYSESVEAAYANNSQFMNVLIVQADLYSMPFRDNSSDKVFCFGVLQHTPRVKEAFLSILRPLKPKGSVVFDIYAKRKGFRNKIATKYWIRPLTKRIPPRLLYPICRSYVMLAWPLARLIHKIPRIGPGINWRLMIPDYISSHNLPDKILREWAILDSFDMLSPQYDNPQRIEDVRRWMEEAGLIERDLQYGYNGIVARATKP